MTVNTELLSRIKERAVHFVLAKRGMTDTHLITDLLSDVPSSNRELIARAISELVMESKLIRIEYRIPELGYSIHAFYLPEGSRFL